MSSEASLPDRAYQAGYTGQPKPKAWSAEQQGIVDSFYAAGARDVGREAVDDLQAWVPRPHDPGEPGDDQPAPADRTDDGG